MRRIHIVTVSLLLLGLLPAAAATIVVDAGGGGDHATLAAAVAAASDGDLIQILPGRYATTVTIEKSLTIEGDGSADQVILDGAGSRIMLLQGEHEVTLRNLRLEGGHGDSGGAIMSWQGMDLTVEDCHFVENSADWGGGAIEARAQTSDLLVQNCLFENNYAGNHAGALAVMFGIDCDIIDCTFLHNSAGAMAGAFTANDPGIVTIEGCVFGYNIGAEHGAIYIVESYFASIRNCTIYGTVAGDHAAVLVHNSALYLEHNIIAHTTGGGGLEVYQSGGIAAQCNLFWDNDGGDVVGGVLDPSDFHENPQLCSPSSGNFAPCDESFAVIGSGCGLIGALGPGCPCGVVRTEAVTWSAVKVLFE